MSRRVFCLAYFFLFYLIACGSTKNLLRDQLLSTDAAQRREAVIKIGKKGLHNRETIATLVKIATWDKDAQVRCVAIEAVGTMKPEMKGQIIELFVFGINDTNVMIRRVSIAALQDLEVYPYNIIIHLQKRLGDSDKLVRDLTMDIFERIGGMGVSMLLKALKDGSNPTMRLTAVVTMGRIGPSARFAVPTLKKIGESTSESEQMKRAAAEALKYITTNEE